MQNLTLYGLLFGIILIINVISIHAEEGDDDAEDDDDGEGVAGAPQENNYETLNKMSFSSPEISEEEAHSHRMPSHLLCDGCKAVAFQLGSRIQIFHDQKHKKKRGMAPESEIIEAVEQICRKETFEGYGLKSLNGVNRISGPGTDAVDEPGMMQGGGRWPNRIATICGELVGEAEEYEIYKNTLSLGPTKLFKFLCENQESKALNTCGTQMSKTEL